MTAQPTRKPDWEALYGVASAHSGLFLASDAAAKGFSTALLSKHVSTGKLLRVQRGIYRLAQFPPGEQEDLVAAWLWSNREGVFSHETALSLHGLSDVLPARAHLTLPLAWKRRRVSPPQGIVLHWAEVGPQDRSWAGGVPVTSALRTIGDCVKAHVPREFIHAAINQALERGLTSEAELTHLANAIAARDPK